MQCGFAFLEAGSVRSKNTTNILIKNLLDSCISAVCYYCLGWAFAYGKPSNAFIGYGQFALSTMPDSMYPNWFFQFVFAATASTIVSGALAERCEFVAYFAYCGLLTGFLYPVVTHWAWASDGWLYVGINGVSYKDFAGSGVVHLLGGVCALVGAAILGPRIGRFDVDENGKNTEIKGHSVPFAAMGGFILMFGFFAFNGGSQANITQPGDGTTVARAMTNTMLSGGAAALTVLFVHKVVTKERKWSLLSTINAALTGMVSACCGCDLLEPWAALLVGCGAGLSYKLVSFLVEKAKIDDPLDAAAVHAGGGFWGLFITPILMDEGIVFKWDGQAFTRLGVNMIGAAAIAAWSAVLIGVLFMALKLLKLFRVSEEVEVKGLDIFKHGEPAYPISAYGHGWTESLPSYMEAIGTVRHRLSSVAAPPPGVLSSSPKPIRAWNGKDVAADIGNDIIIVTGPATTVLNGVNGNYENPEMHVKMLESKNSKSYS